MSAANCNKFVSVRCNSGIDLKKKVFRPWPFIWCKFKRIQSIICQLTFTSLSCFLHIYWAHFCVPFQDERKLVPKCISALASFLSNHSFTFVHRKVENLDRRLYCIWKLSQCMAIEYRDAPFRVYNLQEGLGFLVWQD